MLRIRPVVSAISAVGALAISFNSFACGDEEKPHDDKDKQPSVLCGDEEKPHDDKDKQPSVLCGDEEKPHDDKEKQPSSF